MFKLFYLLYYIIAHLNLLKDIEYSVEWKLNGLDDSIRNNSSHYREACVPTSRNKTQKEL